WALPISVPTGFSQKNLDPTLPGLPRFRNVLQRLLRRHPPVSALRRPHLTRAIFIKKANLTRVSQIGATVVPDMNSLGETRRLDTRIPQFSLPLPRPDQPRQRRHIGRNSGINNEAERLRILCHGLLLHHRWRATDTAPHVIPRHTAISAIMTPVSNMY